MLKRHFIDKNEAGTDEAGRGCLAGPVTAAAIILPNDFDNPVLNDSKQIPEGQRLQLKTLLEKPGRFLWNTAHI